MVWNLGACCLFLALNHLVHYSEQTNIGRNSTEYQSREDIDDEVILTLTRLGHLDPSTDNRSISSLLEINHLRTAVKQFQKYAGLPQTGIVDKQTRLYFKKPRCGLPDVRRRGRRQRRFVLHGTSWPKNHITWSFGQQSRRVGRQMAMDAFQAAFRVWETSGLVKFTYVNNGIGDIHIGFFTRDHNDGVPFDGPGNFLAHAWWPVTYLTGDTHIDDEEDFYGSYDLFSVVVHEFGHSLGLEHSPDQGAIMFAYYKNFGRGARLPPDDLLGIQTLYGNGRTGPKFRPSSPQPQPPFPQPQPPFPQPQPPFPQPQPPFPQPRPPFPQPQPPFRQPAPGFPPRFPQYPPIFPSFFPLPLPRFPQPPRRFFPLNRRFFPG